jgi:hypothetical protein
MLLTQAIKILPRIVVIPGSKGKTMPTERCLLCGQPTEPWEDRLHDACVLAENGRHAASNHVQDPDYLP